MDGVYADKNFIANAENEAMTTISNMEKQDKMPIFFNREYRLIFFL
jgi:hypothetical protein